jgi:hypothetical protein
MVWLHYMPFALIGKQEVYSLRAAFSLMSLHPLLPSEARWWYRNHFHPDLWYREDEAE